MSHLFTATTTERPSLSARPAILRSCCSNGIAASSKTTTTSANFTALRPSPTDNFSILSFIFTSGCSSLILGLFKINNTYIDLSDNFDDLHFKAYKEIIKSHGQIPLPPYIKDDSSKYEYYNNQFAEGGFSVASPTAGLHFSNQQINKLTKEGHQFIFINLDVNIDTFKPITERYLEDHKIHKENYQISKNDYEIILNAKNSNIDIYCIGTTSLRAIESAYVTGELSSSTDYFIYPDTKINIPNYLITNFHAPNSSLLSIVDCIYGSQWKDLYNFAIDSQLKFLSFGDAVLFNVNE